jgi:hypothetical protein
LGPVVGPAVWTEQQSCPESQHSAPQHCGAVPAQLWPLHGGVPQTPLSQ